MANDRINLGRWTRDELDAMLRAGAAVKNIGERIDALSRHFLGVPYAASTLVGSPDRAEVLVVDLHAMDCFTYLDYVEAMRLADSFPRFVEQLRQVRYRSGTVAYTVRNHFFTDWLAGSGVKDITEQIGGKKTLRTDKTLNRKDGVSRYVPGIDIVARQVPYIPAGSFDAGMLGKVKTGDYVGIYAEAEGLDVTHVGIAVRRPGALLFRHASSAEGGVVEGTPLRIGRIPRTR